MTVTYKVLGQANPAATTDTTLYTAPGSTQAVVSTINVCNMAAADATFRVAVRPAGATLAALHYQAYDVKVPANDSIPLTLGITLGATDVITVRASSANVAFSAFGSEIV